MVPPKRLTSPAFPSPVAPPWKFEYLDPVQISFKPYNKDEDTKHIVVSVT